MHATFYTTFINSYLHKEPQQHQRVFFMQLLSDVIAASDVKKFWGIYIHTQYMIYKNYLHTQTNAACTMKESHLLAKFVVGAILHWHLKRHRQAELCCKSFVTQRKLLRSPNTYTNIYTTDICICLNAWVTIFYYYTL